MTNLMVHRADRLAARAVDGEMVILKADDSSLYILNGVATAVWQAADGRSIDEIVDAVVCREYDVDRETALRDVRELVDDLVGQGLMTVSAAAAGRAGEEHDRG
jgi:hypothetical protein